MSARHFAAAQVLLIVAALACSGCGSPSAGSDAQSGFAPGAFPPTLSDTDYHSKAWTRTDCLTCHEKGVDDSPVVRHTSLTPLAKDSKCRSCHVLIPGQQPPK